MPLGFTIRAIARRRRRAVPPPVITGRLDFSSTLASALIALVFEDF